MAAWNKGGEMTEVTCGVCGTVTPMPSKAATIKACPDCWRALLCIVNGIPVEITPAVAAALQERE